MVFEGEAPAGLTQMQGGDVFARRLIFSIEAAESGAWRVHAAPPPRVFSRWINPAGEQVAGARFSDEI